MGIIRQIPISDSWMNVLDLQQRSSPELYLPNSPRVGSAHAGAIRDSFEKIGLSALFCVQGVPTFAYLVQETYDRGAVIETHAKLWNQGLASLLLVLSEDTLRVFSLAKLPIKDADQEFEGSCLIETLRQVEEAVRIKNLISGAETGRLWQEHKEYFKVNERVDTYLLRNLLKSHEALVNSGLNTDTAQALLMQTMFVSYLEDRGIINNAYFRAIFGSELASLNHVLNSKDVGNLELLFESLGRDFNGNIFVSPCSFEPNTPDISLSNDNLLVLSRFRSGKEDMKTGQLHFWGYNFEYIPVELISAVYDKFLGEKEGERKKFGAYYTPRFLADTVMVQIWDTIPKKIKSSGSFLDPACGSGIFLVRAFQLLCEQWKFERNVKSLQWSNLCEILNRVHGWDINGSAIRVTIFSLYIALLEQVSPPDIRRLIKKGRILPELWGKTLIQQDFFTVDSETNQYEVIVGNPPWASKGNHDRKSIKWCSENNCPMPNTEEAWAFSWKALAHLKSNGIASFLVPAMAFLHNDRSFKARAKLADDAYISKIINFSDLRFQLFGGATSPTALIIFGPNNGNKTQYKIDYWSPKANLNLQMQRNITIATIDKSVVTSDALKNDTFILKRRLWMRQVDERLFSYLSSFEKLSAFVIPLREARKNKNNSKSEWVISKGFQPSRTNSSATSSSEVTRYPYIPIEGLNRIYQQPLTKPSWATPILSRKGFEESYGRSKILVSRGVVTSEMRLQATYCKHPATFQQILLGITFPEAETSKAKIITAYLNSKLAVWFAFHGTTSFGSERPAVHQEELLKLPFPSDNLLDENVSDIKSKLIEEIDTFGEVSSHLLSSENELERTLCKIDDLIYQYFGLSEKERQIVEDTVNYIIPASQPHYNTLPILWKPSTANDRQKYTSTLVTELEKWLGPNGISAHLAGKSKDFALLEMSIDGENSVKPFSYSEKNADISGVIASLMKEANIALPGNFTLVPDFKLFIESKLYLIKPLQFQHWMQSSALEDADSIAFDIQSFISTMVKG